MFILFFFFSSRRRHTRFSRDWSSDVCSSDLREPSRPERQFGAHVIRRQRDQLRRGLRGLEREGFRRVHILRSEAEVSSVLVTRTKLFNDLRDQVGPFDVIGDVHGCREELETLLADLGYKLRRDEGGRPSG